MPKPIVYCNTRMDVNVTDDVGSASYNAYGCVMNPDSSLQQLGGGYQVSVSVPLTHGQSAKETKAAILAEIQRGYQVPDLDAEVVLLPDLP